MFSVTIREVFAHHHGVRVGLYTYGACFEYGAVDPATTIGRYCSIASGLRICNRDHPMGYKSMHPFFFNARYGFVAKDRVSYVPLEVGNDVWIGHNVIILPKVRRIGDGAVIGAGAVVTHDVPAYAVVAGNPARIIRYRFPPDMVEALAAERWWDRDIEAVMADGQGFVNSVGQSAEIRAGSAGTGKESADPSGIV
jgi:acetyltransferase-like isoleucine patch superfamily enzyme